MITWKVSSGEEQATMYADQVIKQISDKVMQTEKQDIDQLVQKLTEYLEANGLLRTLRFVDTLHLGMAFGYYYRLFLEKNNVTLEIQDGSSTNGNGSATDSTAGATPSSI